MPPWPESDSSLASGSSELFRVMVLLPCSLRALFGRSGLTRRERLCHVSPSMRQIVSREFAIRAVIARRSAIASRVYQPWRKRGLSRPASDRPPARAYENQQTEYMDVLKCAAGGRRRSERAAQDALVLLGVHILVAYDIIGVLSARLEILGVAGGHAPSSRVGGVCWSSKFHTRGGLMMERIG